MQFNILGACSGLGQKLGGLEFTPDLIRENGFIQILKDSNIKFTDLGDIKPTSEADIWPFLSLIKNKVSKHISQDQILFNLGGDHSIAIGTIAGTLEKFPEARVIWIDAHGDINTPASSLTGNLHGMPLAAILGLFKTELSSAVLKKENLILIGIRDLDHFETEIIKDLNITVITAHEITTEPLLALNKVAAWLKLKNSPLHISFDIDSVDPGTAPATGLRVAGGLNKEFILNLVQKIAATKNVLAIDLVELNATQAKNKAEVDSTLEVFFDILKVFTKI